MTRGDTTTEDDHHHLRESLGVWVLGALDPRARREVAEHVDRCPACATEAAALAPLPGLLNRISEDDLAVPALVSTPEVAHRLDAHLARARDRLRHQLLRWRLATATAATVAVVLAVVAVTGPTRGDDPVELPDRLVAAARPVAAAADRTTGEAAALDWEWGTTVELQVADLPTRTAYVVWVVADDGRREQAGTWGSTTSRAARVYGASSIPRDEVARIEVTAATGELLLTFAFPGT